MKGGIASGATASTAQTFRPGRSVRSISHADAVPTSAQVAEAATTNPIVLTSSRPTSGRISKFVALCALTPDA